MAAMAMVWFTLYKPSTMNPQLSVTLVLFTLSTRGFVVCYLEDITSFGVPTTLFFIILSPIIRDCSLFQGRDVVASVPLFVCAVLFCTVELARGAKALDGLASRRGQGYDHIEASASGIRALMLDQNVDNMTDAKPMMPDETLDELSRMPRKEQIASDTRQSQQEDPFYYKQSELGSSESLQLSNLSTSPRTSIIELVGHIGIDGTLAHATMPYTSPRDREPFNGHLVRSNTPQIDPDECQLHQDQHQSELW
ncbi:hypothetical protein V491_02246 [Pseudogymnoascus sp. VKM F-3775]|nr:hypothetical protein V491_02246 [Pseudogymnoascus sp. VKM F-3775]